MTAQHSTAQHSTAQHSTAQHSTAQHSTAQHSTAQHSTAQHSTAQHSYENYRKQRETERMLSPVSRGCKQNLTLSFFTIPILSILLYSACSSHENIKLPSVGLLRIKPIMITTYAELKAVKDGLYHHYRLGNDINASASWSEDDSSATTCVAYNGNNGASANCRGFTPIGNSNSTTQFIGSLDGAGHKITGLYINRPSTNYVGLFGYTGTLAEIKNIGVTAAYIVGSDYVGGLIGSSHGTVSNSSAMGDVTGTGNTVGGLIGSSYGSVSNSHATGDVKWTGTGTGNANVGGLIGDSNGSVSNSYAMGAVMGGGGDNVGGLIGYADGSGSVSNSYAMGAVMGGKSDVGGLIGELGGSGSVSNSSAMGAVEGTGNSVGGLIGWSHGGSVSNSSATGAVMGGGNNVGGLIGHSQGTGSVSNSSATGAVTGTGTGTGEHVGGLIGKSEGTVSNSYAKGDVEGRNNVGGLIGQADGSVSNSYATGAVTGTGNSVGGLIGNSSASVSNSYATGAVATRVVAGGGTNSVAIGGLIGSSSSSVSNSYATGAVPGTGNSVGGLIGQSHQGSVMGMGTSYFVHASGGGNGIGSGSGSCLGTCTKKTIMEIEALPSVNTWGSGDWDFGSTAQLPALKYAQNPTASPAPRWCGSGVLPACGSLIPGQR